MKIDLYNGDCLEVMRGMEDNSFDSIVTDPPYGLSFMGKKWDYDVPSQEIWEECFRVLKPGGYLLSFAGTRTQHRMAVRIEDAGFEIRDMIAWVYGSGFPKSLNIGKAVDKLQGNKREVVGMKRAGIADSPFGSPEESRKHIEETKGNSPYEGWGTALKPALEPITVARKPLSEKTVAENVLKWGTGGINIDGCRVSMTQEDKEMLDAKASTNNNGINFDVGEGKTKGTATPSNNLGRFPANFIHDGSQEVLDLFPETKSVQSMRGLQHSGRHGGLADIGCNIKEGTNSLRAHNDSGSAARFFYCPKASRKDRNDGLDDFEEKRPDERTETGMGTFVEKGVAKQSNFHPTVKPTELMKYLVKLVTPVGGTVLDPFMGSGSTGRGAKLGGFSFTGIELDKEYYEIAKRRIETTPEKS